MAVYVCRACGARSTQGGDCIICGRSLGSLPRAMVAAAAATAVLGSLWFGLALATGIQLGWMAALFGVGVSGAVVQVSGGRGLSY